MRLHRPSIFLLSLAFILSIENVQAISRPLDIRWCTAWFSSPSPLEAFQKSLKPELLEPYGEHRALLYGFLKRDIPSDPARFSMQLRGRLLNDLELLAKGKSSLDFLFTRGTPLPRKLEELLEAYRLVLGGDIERLNRWATSEERATYLYELLLAENYLNRRELILNFIDSNPHFSESIRMADAPELVVTQSFEKETPSDLISIYFRDPRIPEQQWMNLGDKERFEHLQKITKTGDNPQLMRTEFTPEFVDNLSREPNSSKGNAVFELKKRGFNLSPKAHEVELGRITKDLKETHSIHSHVVFYAPRNDSNQFPQFKAWFGFLNDYYLLKGMEEGLHRSTDELLINGNSIVGSIQTRKDSFDAIRKFNDVSETNLKWMNVGLRGKIYGTSIDPRYIKMGLEGRDISRNSAVIADFVKRVSQSVSVAKWKALPKEVSRTPLPRISFDPLELGMKSPEFKRLYKIFPEMMIPFNRLENFPVFHFSEDGKLVSEVLDSSAQEKIIKARAAYVTELRTLLSDIEKSETKSGVPENPDAIETTLKWMLTDWAKAAQASKVFQNF